MIDYSKQITIPEHVQYREVDDSAVIINLNNEQYYGLNEVGTRVWQVLTSSESIQKAFETLLEEYDVEEDRLKEDLQKLLIEFKEQGLVRFSDDL